MAQSRSPAARPARVHPRADAAGGRSSLHRRPGSRACPTRLFHVSCLNIPPRTEPNPPVARPARGARPAPQRMASQRSAVLEHMHTIRLSASTTHCAAGGSGGGGGGGGRVASGRGGLTLLTANICLPDGCANARAPVPGPLFAAASVADFSGWIVFFEPNIETASPDVRNTGVHLAAGGLRITAISSFGPNM